MPDLYALTEPTATKLLRLLNESPDAQRPAGRGQHWVATALVECLDDTPIGGSGVAAQCYPGVVLSVEGDETNPPLGENVWLTLLDEGGYPTVPNVGQPYLCLLTDWVDNGLYLSGTTSGSGVSSGYLSGVPDLRVRAFAAAPAVSAPDCVTGGIPGDIEDITSSVVTSPVADTVYALGGGLTFLEDGTYLVTCTICAELNSAFPTGNQYPIYAWLAATNVVAPTTTGPIAGTLVTFSASEFGTSGSHLEVPLCKSVTGVVTVCADQSPLVDVNWKVPFSASEWSGVEVLINIGPGTYQPMGGAGLVTLISQYCNCEPISGGSVIFPSGTSGGVSGSGLHTSGGVGGSSGGMGSGGGGGSGATGCCDDPPSYLFATYTNQVGPCQSFNPLFLPSSGSQQWTASDAPVVVKCDGGVWGLSDTRFGLGYTVTQVSAQCGPPFMVVLFVNYISGPCAGGNYTLTLTTN